MTQRRLHLQLHIDRPRSFDLDAALDACRAAAAAAPPTEIRIQVNEAENYANIDFRAHDIRPVWRAVCTLAMGDDRQGAAVRAASMALCEGDHGWDDYRTLHHYDPAVLLDPVPEPG